MDAQIQQLLEMGATRVQAKAALKRYKDVMEAAEHIFDGQFDDAMDCSDDEVSNAANNYVPKMVTPERGSRSPVQTNVREVDDEEEDNSDGSDDNYYVDDDSDYEVKVQSNDVLTNADPYSGIFFSKDRREEVIEVEEDTELVTPPGSVQPLKLMTQGQWMKGCPEGGEQGFLFSLYTQLTEGACSCPHDCGGSIPRDKSDFFIIYPEFTTYIEHLQKIVRQKCKICMKEFCFACGEPIVSEKMQRSGSEAEISSLFHCSNLQGVILGIGLSMLEQMFAEQTHEVAFATNAKKRKAETPAPVVPALTPDLDDDEDAYASMFMVNSKKAKGGIGYAGNSREDTTGQAEALANQRAKDEKMGYLLTAVRHYLPSINRPGGGHASDYLVHPTTLAHLRRRFNYVGSALLRNDSLTDMSDRSVLYFELLEWLETISNHEALASMMAMPIMVVASIKAVNTKKSASGRQIRERTIVYEGSSGPRELLESIVIQAQAAVKGLEGTVAPRAEPEEMSEEQKRKRVDDKGKGKELPTIVSDENAKLLQFCRRILATAKAIDNSLRETKGDWFVDRLHASLPKIYNTVNDMPSDLEVHVKADASEEQIRQLYTDWAARVRFEYCDLTVPSADVKIKQNANDEDTIPHYKFCYNNEARNLANSDIPKRSLAIAKELAVLTTNLPVSWGSSIFLRVDETRVDIIKALITGPEGTPYHNGCFLFDIFLGSNYNQTPPVVKYMTTNGGKYRFNPNLYADGKVCLSLLGTWQGPGWISGKSTLLQVLISIQSMILCEEPYLNEPSWANSSGTPASRGYSANVRRMVVNTAMLGNLKNPPEPFGDVIRTHYKLKAQSVMSQLDVWLSEDNGQATVGDGSNLHVKSHAGPGSSSSTLQKDVEELKCLLVQLRDEVSF